MKRILSILLTTVLLLGILAACGTTPADTTPTPTTPAPTTPAPTTPAPTTPAPTTPAPTTPAPTTPAPVVTTPVATEPILEPDYAACRVSPAFSSQADLAIYMSTGSTAPEDYSKRPRWFYAMPTLKEIEAGGGYLPLDKLFDIDESLFEYSEIWIYRGDPFGLCIDYHFDKTIISISNTSMTSTSQFTNYGATTAKNITLIQDLSAPLPVENGYVSYVTNGVEVIYQIRDGVKIDVRFVYDGFCVIVRAARWYSDDVAAEVQIFMQNDAFSDVHPLFANDNQQVSAAVATMKTAVESRVSVAK